MLELTGGKVAKGVIDVYPGKRQVEPILLSAAEVKRLLGMEVGVNEIVRTLELLGFGCEQTELPSSVRVNVPWWRTDISCTADLVEEVARIIGYDNIPTTMLGAPLPEHESVPMLALRGKLRSILVSCGFQEVLTYSLTSLEVMSRLSPELRLKGAVPVKVANPMSRDHEYLRTSLRTGLLSVLARNQKYEENGIRLFEIGKVFLSQEKDLPQEKEMLCAVLSSSQGGLSWRGEAEPVDFFIAKGVLETLLSRLELAATSEAGEDEGLIPGRSADITVGNDKVGVIGELHPKVSEAFELSGTAYLIEIDLTKLESSTGGPKKYEPISRYPSTTRDIALLVDESITHEKVYGIVKGFSLVDQVTLFDLYSGEQVPVGKKSFAFRIVYQSPTHTLTDEEVDKVQQQILDKLARELGATLRA
jgi:phenylalanyl-tRNA synthetase beta chain